MIMVFTAPIALDDTSCGSIGDLLICVGSMAERKPLSLISLRNAAPRLS